MRSSVQPSGSIAFLQTPGSQRESRSTNPVAAIAARALMPVPAWHPEGTIGTAGNIGMLSLTSSLATVQHARLLNGGRAFWTLSEASAWPSVHEHRTISRGAPNSRIERDSGKAAGRETHGSPVHPRRHSRRHRHRYHAESLGILTGGCV